jgi:hypothetical protein
VRMGGPSSVNLLINENVWKPGAKPPSLYLLPAVQLFLIPYRAVYSAPRAAPRRSANDINFDARDAKIKLRANITRTWNPEPRL